MKYLNALYLIPGLGSVSLRQLFGRLQSGEAIWNAPRSELEQSGIGPALIESILSSRPTIDPDAEWEKVEKENITILTSFDDRYPILLKEIHNPPFLLYCRGNIDCLSLPSIAIVGSRKFTDYGKQAVERLGHDLSKAGLCIVSGLALGIDAIAHRSALDARGKTISILGSGVDQGSVYPRANYNLSEEIIRLDGLLVSELPVGTPPTTGSFPARDRIMAGLTLGTLVIEAAEKSGSLITPNHAIEFNREVFAIPGSIFSPQSVGTNALIKKGAKVATSVRDILEELRIDYAEEKRRAAPNKPPLELTAEEKTVANVLSPDPTHVDRIIKLTKLETSCAISTLSMLEIKGVVRNIGGQNYIRL